MHGNKDAVQHLLKNNAIPTLQNKEGKLPCEVAQNYEVYQILENYSMTTKKNDYGRVAFHNKILMHNSRTDKVQKMLQTLQKPIQQTHDLAKIIEEKREIRTQLERTGKYRNQVLRKVQITEIDQSDIQKSILQQAAEESQGVQDIQAPLKRNPWDFALITELGKGSFGAVYLVKKNDTNKLYAMKILQKSLVMGQNLVRYAMTERNILSVSTHPFIVNLNYAFQTSDKLFLILDYASGGDLGYHLSKEKRFNEYRARIYLCEILLAIEYLHANDIIYRDLKPENVVIDTEGHALLTDFGLSKEGIFTDQQTKSFCGSIAYLAPEMLKRQGHGKMVDWYLLGVLLYEMLTGRPPYFSHNREELFYNIEKGKLKIPSYFSINVKNLLIALLERNPSKRLGSQNGAEEIKSHPFFEGIDWQLIYKKQIKPPFHTPKVLKMKKVNPNKVYGETDKKNENLMGWSFAIQIGKSSVIDN